MGNSYLNRKDNWTVISEQSHPFSGADAKDNLYGFNYTDIVKVEKLPSVDSYINIRVLKMV